MSERMVGVLALATIVGALWANSFPLLFALGIVAIAFVLRSSIALCVGVCLLSSGLAANAWHDLKLPAPDEVAGVATLVTDPSLEYGALRVEVRVNDKHFQAWIKGENKQVLQAALAGQVAYVEGTTRPLSGKSAPSLRRRHTVANLDITQVRDVHDGNVVSNMANAVRRCIQHGARSLPADQSALLSGFVFGDDRLQSNEMTSAFRDAGLSHLLAVSGQNVMFVLLVVSPVLKRFSLTGRLVGGVLVLVFFGVVTRWEPSVIRAETMALIAMIGMFIGKPVSAWRALALATTTAVLVDPFLAGSVGFAMSVSACAGMVVGGKRLENVIPGPIWFRRVIAYSAAAQLGVAPIQCIVFGGLPLVGLLANVAVEPVAAAIMIWGVIGGILAGLIGDPIATLIHFPSRLMLSYVETVATTAAGAHLGNWSVRSLYLVFIVVVGRIWWRARPTRQRDYVSLP